MIFSKKIEIPISLNQEEIDRKWNYLLLMEEITNK